jgi:chemotaxis protein MotB
MAEEEKKCPPKGAPAWMATFADMMSLLLVLFVLLLTFAEMNVVKYKQMAGAMRDAFGVSKQDKLAGVIEIDGQLERKSTKSVSQTVTLELPEPTESPEEKEFEVDPEATPEQQADEIENELAKIIAKEAAEQGVEVEKNGNEVKIRFPSEIAFSSGSATIGQDFSDLLDKLTDVFKKSEGEVLVAGHTDNIPLGGGGPYRDNWELSAARATSVVHHLLTYSDIPANKLAVQGYGDSRPLAPNDSPESRAKNRRVEITLVLGEKQAAEASKVQDQLDGIFGKREPTLLK